MKKYLCSVSLIVILLSISAYSQPVRGNFILGGTVGYTQNNYKLNPNYPDFSGTGQTNKQFSFSPSFGYFASDNLIYGLGIGYSSNINEIDNNISYSPFSTETFTTELYFITPYIRYYQFFNKTVGVFANLSFKYGSGNVDNKYNSSYYTNNKIDVTEYSLSLNPGISINLNNKFLIEASIGFLSYNSTSYKMTGVSNINTQSAENSTYGLSLDLTTINLGIQFLL
jgi:hypothetical protein